MINLKSLFLDPVAFCTVYVNLEHRRKPKVKFSNSFRSANFKMRAGLWRQLDRFFVDVAVVLKDDFLNAEVKFVLFSFTMRRQTRFLEVQPVVRHGVFLKQLFEVDHELF